MAFVTETKPAEIHFPAKQHDGDLGSQLLLLTIAGVTVLSLTKKQLRRMKMKLLLRAVQWKLKNLFHFRKSSSRKDPGFAILLVCGAVFGLALLLGASMLTAVLIALLLGAIIGAMAYSGEY